MTRAVKVCMPGESQVVNKKPRFAPLSSPPKTYGASRSIQVTFPSIRKSTSVTSAGGTLGVATQLIRWGRVV
jgi:hypothetical protein